MSKFFERSLKVAEHFLQTAVVIDDRAFHNERRAQEATPTELTAPPTLATIEATSPHDSNATEPVTPDPPIEESLDPDPHGIDARAVIDSFAQRGIVCSVLRREPDEDLTAVGDRAHLLSVAADIVIVDWQVHRPDGSDSNEETQNFLQSAVRESMQSQPQQLRLIVVYTGSLDLFKVSEEVGKCLESAAESAPMKEGELRSECSERAWWYWASRATNESQNFENIRSKAMPTWPAAPLTNSPS